VILSESLLRECGQQGTRGEQQCSGVFTPMTYMHFSQ